MLHRLIPVLCTTLLLGGCLGIKTSQWQATGFAAAQPGWQYYRWDDPPLSGDEHGDGMVVVDSALRQQVDQSLAALGYREDPQRAQFELDYRVGDTAEAGQTGPSYPMGPREEFERVMAGPNAEYEVSSRFYTHQTLGYHQVSHLKLTIYDIASSRILWEASSSKLVDDPNASAQRVASQVAKATRKMLKPFPAAVASAQ